MKLAELEAQYEARLEAMRSQFAALQERLEHPPVSEQLQHPVPTPDAPPSAPSVPHHSVQLTPSPLQQQQPPPAPTPPASAKAAQPTPPPLQEKSAELEAQYEARLDAMRAQLAVLQERLEHQPPPPCTATPQPQQSSVSVQHDQSAASPLTFEYQHGPAQSNQSTPAAPVQPDRWPSALQQQLEEIEAQYAARLDAMRSQLVALQVRLEKQPPHVPQQSLHAQLAAVSAQYEARLEAMRVQMTMMRQRLDQLERLQKTPERVTPVSARSTRSRPPVSFEPVAKPAPEASPPPPPQTLAALVRAATVDESPLFRIPAVSPLASPPRAAVGDAGPPPIELPSPASPPLPSAWSRRPPLPPGHAPHASAAVTAVSPARRQIDMSPGSRSALAGARAMLAEIENILAPTNDWDSEVDRLLRNV
jgi:uncharacterized protein YceH (UPF0502 family)